MTGDATITDFRPSDALARLLADRDARVDRAAAQLDAAWAAQGGWAHRIDLTALDLSACDACLLGQLYRPVRRWWQPWTWGRRSALRGWGRGIRALGGVTTDTIGVFSSALYHESWVRAIRARRPDLEP